MPRSRRIAARTLRALRSTALDHPHALEERQVPRHVPVVVPGHARSSELPVQPPDLVEAVEHLLEGRRNPLLRERTVLLRDPREVLPVPRRRSRHERKDSTGRTPPRASPSIPQGIRCGRSGKPQASGAPERRRPAARLCTRREQGGSRKRREAPRAASRRRAEFPAPADPAPGLPDRRGRVGVAGRKQRRGTHPSVSHAEPSLRPATPARRPPGPGWKVWRALGVCREQRACHLRPRVTRFHLAANPPTSAPAAQRARAPRARRAETGL
jgi:hypothetical protein